MITLQQAINDDNKIKFLKQNRFMDQTNLLTMDIMKTLLELAKMLDEEI